VSDLKKIAEQQIKDLSTRGKKEILIFHPLIGRRKIEVDVFISK
jgi:hypothetical protein